MTRPRSVLRLGLRRRPAVDRDDRPGDDSCPVAQQEGGHLGDLVGLGHGDHRRPGGRAAAQSDVTVAGACRRSRCLRSVGTPRVRRTSTSGVLESADRIVRLMAAAGPGPERLRTDLLPPLTDLQE
jgi:hypothetical protein